MRIGAASVLQETNTFSLNPCRMSDFTVATGEEAASGARGTNSEMAGILEGLRAGGAEAVPILRAWAMPSGPLTADAFRELREMLLVGLAAAGPVDGLALSLHGAMAADRFPDADGRIISEVREFLGPDVPLAVCLDLHANLTRQMVRGADGLSAYHTDPHTDMAAAGERAARQLLRLLGGERFAIGLAKRPMLIPAETMNTDHGPLAEIRRRALAEAPAGLADLLLFPVQPWLDVPELGLGVAAVVKDDPSSAREFAEATADRIWERRGDFTMDDFLEPEAAIAAARASRVRPFLLAQSADAPTAGASGDSPALIEPLAALAPDLVSYVTAADPAAVEQCHRAGAGAEVTVQAGGRFGRPVASPGFRDRRRNGGGGRFLPVGRGRVPRDGSVNGPLCDAGRRQPAAASLRTSRLDRRPGHFPVRRPPPRTSGHHRRQIMQRLPSQLPHLLLRHHRGRPRGRLPPPGTSDIPPRPPPHVAPGQVSRPGVNRPAPPRRGGGYSIYTGAPCRRDRSAASTSRWA